MRTPGESVEAVQKGEAEKGKNNRKVRTHDYVIALSEQLIPLFPPGYLPQDLAHWLRAYDKCEAYQEVGRVRFTCYDKGIAVDEGGSAYKFKIEFKKLRQFLFWKWVSVATIRCRHITVGATVYALRQQEKAETWEKKN